MRGFIEISQKKVPKRAFRARLLQNFTEKASKTSVSCEASDNFHRRRFQNDRFVRGFIEISQKKAPKQAFRARPLQNFTKEVSKMIVSCEASSKFHRTSFQNERFVRSFRQFSQKKLPKASFRALLPTIFTEKTSKRTESLKWKKIPPKNGKKFPEKFWTHAIYTYTPENQDGTQSEGLVQMIFLKALLGLIFRFQTCFFFGCVTATTSSIMSSQQKSKTPMSTSDQI